VTVCLRAVHSCNSIFCFPDLFVAVCCQLMQQSLRSSICTTWDRINVKTKHCIITIIFCNVRICLSRLLVAAR